jgi:hypothetical protein
MREKVIDTVGTALDVTDQRRFEAAVRRHDAILEAFSFAAVRFLEITGWEWCITEVQRRLGAAAEVSRITSSRMMWANTMHCWRSPAPNSIRRAGILHGRRLFEPAGATIGVRHRRFCCAVSKPPSTRPGSPLVRNRTKIGQLLSFITALPYCILYIDANH